MANHISKSKQIHYVYCTSQLWLFWIYCFCFFHMLKDLWNMICIRYGKKDNSYDIKLFSVAISTCIGTWYHKVIGSINCSNLFNISIDTNRILVILTSCNQCVSPLMLWVLIPIMASGTICEWLAASMVVNGYSGLLHPSNWPPRYSWNTVESGVKHNIPNPSNT